MLLVEKMDEGPLIAQGICDIKPDDNNTSLTSALISLSDQLLSQTVPSYLAGDLVPYEQSEDSPTGRSLKVSYSRKLTKQDSWLDFTKPAAVLEREIRAFNEWPRSRMELAGTEIIITKSHVVSAAQSGITPGKLCVDSKTLLVGTNDGCLAIDRLKPAGKAEMNVAAFLAGYRAKLTLDE
jgi:methionyl-tRNA formyltransferase